MNPAILRLYGGQPVLYAEYYSHFTNSSSWYSIRIPNIKGELEDHAISEKDFLALPTVKVEMKIIDTFKDGSCWEQQWSAKLTEARKLSHEKLRWHAGVSLDNHHQCRECFTCACAVVLSEHHG